MKVKVNVKHVPLNQVEYFLNEALSEALADLDSAHREMEKLFQENKDLRVSEAHLRDDLVCAQARIEKLIAELAQVKQDTAFWKKAAAENAELAEQLRELQAVFADLQLEHQELGEDYDALVKTKREYGEEIDRLRKVVTNLQTNRFTLDEIFAKIMMSAEYERITSSTDK